MLCAQQAAARLPLAAPGRRRPSQATPGPGRQLALGVTAQGGTRFRRNRERPHVDITELVLSSELGDEDLLVLPCAADMGRPSETSEPQPEETPKQRGRKKGSGAGSSGGGGGKRRSKGDPHRLLNVDAEPMESDPGDLGRVAPGVLEKYEHLEKLHPPPQEGGEGGDKGGGAGAGEGGGQPGGGPGRAAAARLAGGAGAGAGAERPPGEPDATPGDMVSVNLYLMSDPVLPYSQPMAAPSAAAAGGGELGGGGGSGESDILKTDAPGVGETQHPGEPPPGSVAEATGAAEARAAEGGEAPPEKE